jgi:hypothetical protein
METIVELHEMSSDNAPFENDDTVTLDDGTVFKVKRAQPWDSSIVSRPTFYFLILEKVSHE